MYDRKTWIIIALCGGLLAANFYYTSKKQQENAAYLDRAQAAQKAAAPEATSTDPAAAPTAGLTIDPPPPPTEETLITLENEKVIFTFTNIGGGIKYAEFKDEFEVGSLTRRVRVNRFGGGPIGALTGEDESIENIPYAYNEAESVAGKKVVYIAKLASGLVAKKIYSLDQSGKPGSPYLLDLSMQFENAAPVSLNLNQWSIFLGEAAPLYQSEVAQQTGFFWRENGSMHFEHGGVFKGGMISAAKDVFFSPTETMQYGGVTNQFFSTVLRPKNPEATTLWAKHEFVNLPNGKAPVQSIRAGLRFPDASLATGEQQSIDYQIFVGPKDNTMLRKMDHAGGEGWGDLMQYGWFWWVSRPLNWLLNNLHHLFDKVANKWAWGLSIIFLTVIVRLFIWPLHAKSTRTMKRMSKLQPEIAKLKEKYPDDPNKLNTEMMGLYRKFGINPLGGCLPMVIQIPIFFGFYRMLQYAVELRHESFLWVQDLSQPDTLYTFHLPFALPILGTELPINILPIVMAITSFLQMQMTPKTGDKMQQRIVMFMPFIFFFFCYNFASALALYWTTQNIFSIGQTWLMNKIPEPELKARKDNGKKSWVQRAAERQAEMQKAKGGNLANTEEPKKKRPRTGG
jgi:YidC/Oxa1 family membrane protein insertase